MPKTPSQNAAIREQTRKHLIGKALELFAQKGYHATSISQIAKAAGMAKGALYHYFDGKQALFAAIIKDGMEEIGDIYTVPQGQTPREHFRSIMKKLFQSMEERKDFWKLYSTLMMQGSLIEEMREVVQPFVDSTMGGFAAMLDQLGLKKSEAEILAFGSFIDGISVNYLFIHGDQFPVEEVIEIYLDSFLGKEEK